MIRHFLHNLFIYFLLLFCFCLRMSEGVFTNDSLRYNHFYRTLATDNLLAVDSNTVFPVDNFSQCLLACNADDTCTSFFSNTMTSECMLSDVCYRRNMSTMPMSTEMGWNYFQSFCGCNSCCDLEWISVVSTNSAWRKFHDICNCSSCCDVGWTQYENSCFRVDASRRSWADSKAYCEELNASLAEPRTQRLNSFLTLQKKKVSNVEAWIGAEDSITEGMWRWSTLGDEFEYTNWLFAHPDNYGNSDCLSFMYTGEWHDNICSLLFEVICQKDI